MLILNETSSSSSDKLGILEGEGLKANNICNQEVVVIKNRIEEV
jgi:hypothetical protein